MDTESEVTNDVDVHLGRDYQDDLEDGHESLGTEHIKGVPFDKVDRTEIRTRSTDYERFSNRVRIGGKGELSLDRVSLDGGGRAHGGGDGADWEANQSTAKSHVAMCGTGFKHDTRGAVAMTCRAEGVSEELHKEVAESGLRLGINSVDVRFCGFAMASADYIRNKEYWRQMPDWKKQEVYKTRKQQRANREWNQMRSDSVDRKSNQHFKVWQNERRANDPYYDFGDPAEIEREAGIDRRSADQLAVSWRMAQDEKAFDTLVLKYAAALNGIGIEAQRAKFKRNDQQYKELAECIFVTDALATDVVLPDGFDKQQLLSSIGGELAIEAIEMDTDMSDSDRRRFLIEGAETFYKRGNIFPPPVWAPLSELLDDVVAILEKAGIDMSAPAITEEIDWSRV